MSQRTSRYSNRGRTVIAASRRTPVKQPTVKQMQSVPCPACKVPAGTPCTLQSGHRARADAFRSSTTGAAPKQSSTGNKAQTAGATRGKQGQKAAPGTRSCAICRKPLGKRPTAKAKSGKTCHASCLTQAQQAGTGKPQPPAPRQWNTAAAEREFNRNKEAVEAGRTFRGHKPSGWRLGNSPSSAGEIKR